MKRRQFIAAAGAAAVTPLISLAGSAAPQADEPQYLELQQYQLLHGPKRGLVHDYLEKVAIPAYNRMGIGPVGVFQVMYGANAPTLYVLLPHPTLESFATATQRLLADETHMKDGAAYVNAPLADPAYVRKESMLLRAFADMPRVEIPPQKTQNKFRIFELRTYESHSEKAAQKKIEMFNEGGEIPIFRRVGLTPVFFGETLAGPKMPNLTYMLAFDDMAARDAAWKAFSADPDWKKLSADPQYADTVSAISDIILQPTRYSQI